MTLSEIVNGVPKTILSLGLPILILLGILLIFSTYAFYQLYLHPLAKYPGPPLAALTTLHQLYYGYHGTRHLLFYHLHARYGPVVRYGPSHLSFISTTALKKIYAHDKAIEKSEFYDGFANPGPNLHNARDKAIHLRKRKVIANAFSASATREMEPYVLNNIDLLAKMMGPEQDAVALASQSFAGVIFKKDNDALTEKKKPEADHGNPNPWSAPRNMAAWFAYMAMDILGDLCYGKDFSLLTKPDNRFTLDLLAYATKRNLLCGISPFIHRTGLDKIIFRSIAKKRMEFVAYSARRLQERTKLGAEGNRKDFFHYLLTATSEDGYSFNKRELWGESTLLLVAGSDTTSTSLSGTVFYLVRSPWALKKATEEVRSAFSTKEDIRTGPAMASCHYLRACIDEGMRLSPAVGSILPRLLLADVEIDGIVIPKGTTVGVPHYALQHNKAYNDAPFFYVPERWITGATWPTGHVTTPVEVTATTAAFAPFSVGARGCIGKQIAYTEMMNTLARLLWEYDLRRAVGTEKEPGEGDVLGEVGRTLEWEYQLKDTFTSVTPNSPLVEFRRREDL